MSQSPLLQQLEKKQLKKDISPFHVGDTIKVHTRIEEGGKQRIQVFIGTVIARKGRGLAETFILHRVAYGEGMERVFVLNSPRIVKIEIAKEGHVRRAKLYDLCGTTGKKAKVKRRLVSRNSTRTEIAQQPALEVEPQKEPIAQEEATAVPSAENAPE